MACPRRFELEILQFWQCPIAFIAHHPRGACIPIGVWKNWVMRANPDDAWIRVRFAIERAERQPKHYCGCGALMTTDRTAPDPFDAGGLLPDHE